jgi:hypothetical protein
MQLRFQQTMTTCANCSRSAVELFPEHFKMCEISPRCANPSGSQGFEREFARVG